MVREWSERRIRPGPELRGSGKGEREGGALSAVHGAGKKAASCRCPHTELRCKNGTRNQQLVRLEMFFLPTNVENTHVDVQFKQYSRRAIL